MNRSSVNSWLAGESRAIRGGIGVRMLPHLRQYLPPEEIAEDEIGITSNGERLIEEFRHRVQDAVASSVVCSVNSYLFLAGNLLKLEDFQFEVFAFSQSEEVYP